MDNADRMGPINASSPDILDMRTTSLGIIKHDNPIEVINNLYLEQGKKAVRAKNGEKLTQTAQGMMLASERETRKNVNDAKQKKATPPKVAPGVKYDKGVTQPATFKELEAEADKLGNHSAKLARHLDAAGQTKPTDAVKGSLATHHVVARTDTRALPSRVLLFQWGIGINDVDNGIRLPRWLVSQKPASLTDATVHAIVHTDVYHTEVHYRLREVARTHPTVASFARVELRGIKQELTTGVFPF